MQLGIWNDVKTLDELISDLEIVRDHLGTGDVPVLMETFSRDLPLAPIRGWESHSIKRIKQDNENFVIVRASDPESFGDSEDDDPINSVINKMLSEEFSWPEVTQEDIEEQQRQFVDDEMAAMVEMFDNNPDFERIENPDGSVSYKRKEYLPDDEEGLTGFEAKM